MDGRADHTPIFWQIAQFSDLTEDAEDIEGKKSVRTQKSRKELLIEDTRHGLSGVGGILTKTFEFNDIPVLVTEESVVNASYRMELPKR